MGSTATYRLVNEGLEPTEVRQTRPNGWRERRLGRGVLTGLVAGFLGTVVMTQFQNAWTKAAKSAKRKATEDSDKQQREGEAQREDATMLAAERIAHIAGRELSHEQRAKLGPVVHYAFGTVQGGLYSVSLEAMGKEGDIATGLIFGAALFGTVDEVAVPALHLSSGPTEAPLSSHLYGLASHLVYGVSTELSRRVLAKVL